MSHFSGAIKLADGIDDYLSAAQNCVVPLIQTESQRNGKRAGIGNDNDPLNGLLGSFSIDTKPPTSVEGAGFNQMKATGVGEKAQITLADCLSCSGCVTTAESILISQHSAQQLIEILTMNSLYTTPLSTSSSLYPSPPAPYRPIVFSLSLASILSISTLLSTPPAVTLDLLTIFLHSIGVSKVLYPIDSQLTVLAQAARDFIDRYTAHAAQYGLTFDTSTDTTTTDTSSSPLPLPLFSSECPGWVCFVEKTQGASVLPHLSTLRTPQAVLGLYAKMSLYSENTAVDNLSLSQLPSTSPLLVFDPDVLHVSVQPCYDKKLEATREMITLPPQTAIRATRQHNTSTKDTQCCQTTAPSSSSSSSECCGGTNNDVTTTECCNTESSTPQTTQCCSSTSTSSSHSHHNDTNTDNNDVVNLPYVDLVLSTHELVDLLVNQTNFDPANLPILLHNTTTTGDNMVDTTQTSPSPSSPSSPSYPLTALSIAILWAQIWSQYTSYISNSSLNTTFILPITFFPSPALTAYTPPSLILAHVGKNQLFRLPGAMTSSGGYAESVFYASIQRLFTLPLHDTVLSVSPSINLSGADLYSSLDWISGSNLDMKGVFCDYLGEGHALDSMHQVGQNTEFTSSAPNSDSPLVGIYAVYGKDTTLVFPGRPLPSQCNKPQAQSTQKTPVRAKIQSLSAVDDEDIIFAPSSSSRPSAQPVVSAPLAPSVTSSPISPSSANTLITSCECISCVPLFPLPNNPKMRIVRNKSKAPTVLYSPQSPSATQTVPQPSASRPTGRSTFSLDEDDLSSFTSAPRPSAPSMLSRPTPRVGAPSSISSKLQPGSIITSTVPESLIQTVVSRLSSNTSSLLDVSTSPSVPSVTSTDTPTSTVKSRAFRLTSPLSTPVCVLHCAAAYGLRNLQGMLRHVDDQAPTLPSSLTSAARLGNTTPPSPLPPPTGPSSNIPSSTSSPSTPPHPMYHYVEMMSCPSGCINGGAQLTITQQHDAIEKLNNILDIHLDTSIGQLVSPKTPTTITITNPNGTTTTKEITEPLITLQKRLLERISMIHNALPCLYEAGQVRPCLDNGNNKSKLDHHSNNDIVYNTLTTPGDTSRQLFYTAFHHVETNEALQALRW